MAIKTRLHVWDVKDTAQQIDEIRRGLPASDVKILIGCFHVPQNSMEYVLRISHRTLARRQAQGELLKPDESERVVRLGSVFRFAVETLGTAEAAQRWFKKPRAELKGDTPFMHCDTEPGRMEVEQVLTRIADGVYA